MMTTASHSRHHLQIALACIAVGVTRLFSANAGGDNADVQAQRFADRNAPETVEAVAKDLLDLLRFDLPATRGSPAIRAPLTEVRKLCELNGIKEIIIVAQDTTAYGTDIYGKPSLVALLKALVKIEKLSWIRMLYCYPELISDELIDVISSNHKILNYLDIPFQHASGRILKLMGRKGTLDDYKALINKLRARIPDVVIRTTFITGFPGESEVDFEILWSFIQESKFKRVGVFTYYDEDGAASFNLPDKVPFSASAKRRDALMEMQNAISLENNKKRVGNIYDIIIGDVADDGIFYEGRSYGEAPEIDGKVYIASAEPLEQGSMVRVKILEAREYDLIGEALL